MSADKKINNREGATEGGDKDDNGKIRWGLLPMECIEEVAEVLSIKAPFYGAWNWSKGMDYSRCYDAALRHINAFWIRKERLDDGPKGTDKHHLACAICNLLFLMTFDKATAINGKYEKYDDRPNLMDLND